MLEMSQPHPVHGGYPMEFRAVMMRALKRAPNERYQSACDMISALEDALSGDVKAECPSTFQFKIISKIRGLIIKKPTTGPLMIWAAFILGCASLIFIGTLL